jgi:hypothetical protein
VPRRKNPVEQSEQRDVGSDWSDIGGALLADGEFRGTAELVRR